MNNNQDDSFYKKAMADVNRSHKNYKNNRITPEQLTKQPSRAIDNADSSTINIGNNDITGSSPKKTRAPLFASIQDPAIDETDNTQSILFIRSGLQKDIIRRLRRGNFDIDNILDLHGLHGWEAEQALEDFIVDSLDKRYKYVMIIHGKGYRSEAHRSILKPLTINYLKTLADVLGFCSAQPQDGGTGAVYILLKRKQI